MTLVVIAGLVAHQFEGVLAFDQRPALGDEAFEFDRVDFAAILLALGAALRLLVVIEFAAHAFGGAVEEIDGRSEEVVEVGLEAGVRHGGDKGIEDVGDGTGEHVAFGQRAWVGFVGEGTVAIELQFGQDVVGRRSCVLGFKVVLLAQA